LSLKLILDGPGGYLGMEKGCFTLRDKGDEVKRYPLFEQVINEVQLRSGNSVSTGALAAMGFWGIDCMISTARGRPVALLRSLDDDSHVGTRVAQYEATKNGRGYTVARSLVAAKLEGQSLVLTRHGLEPHGPEYREKIRRVESSDPGLFTRQLTGIEGKHTQAYYKQIFGLLPEEIRPERRRGFAAYDGANNVFNLAYEVLAWRVHVALIAAKLEPYLGFLHSTQAGKPSLVCDLQELYRHMIDGFLIDYCAELRGRDFTTKMEAVSRRKRAKREYLSDSETRILLGKLNGFFESTVKVKRIRIGGRQSVGTLINEEALLLAKYLRGERAAWSPRVAIPGRLQSDA
jgi:CRISPR-associated protein Cas1